MKKGGSTFNLGESIGSKYDVLLLYSITLVLDPVVQKTRQTREKEAVDGREKERHEEDIPFRNKRIRRRVRSVLTRRTISEIPNRYHDKCHRLTQSLREKGSNTDRELITGYMCIYKYICVHTPPPHTHTHTHMSYLSLLNCLK